MKTLVVTLALATLFASSAVARISKHYEPLVPDVAVGGSLKIILDPNVVIEGGRVIGRDPDPNIRLQMRRDCCDNY